MDADAQKRQEGQQMKKIIWLAAVYLVLLFVERIFPQGLAQINVDKMTVPVVAIANKDLIDFFVYEFFIAETLVTKMEIIDATGNGFGEDDLVKTYPSEQIYFPAPSDSAQKIMNGWEFKANFQIVSENREPEAFEKLPGAKAENGIFANLLKGVNRNYQDQPISVWFQRDDKGITFEMWGFNKNKLNYTPPPPPVP